MVAFKINRAATALKSEPIFNIGSTSYARDFRHEDRNALTPVDKIFDRKKRNVALSLKQLESVLSKIKLEQPGIARNLRKLLD